MRFDHFEILLEVHAGTGAVAMHRALGLLLVLIVSIPSKIEPDTRRLRLSLEQRWRGTEPNRAEEGHAVGETQRQRDGRLAVNLRPLAEGADADGGNGAGIVANGAAEARHDAVETLCDLVDVKT